MAERKTPKRQCKGKTKANKACGATPLRPGTELGGVKVSGKWCRQHDEDLPDSARIGGAQPGAGRPPNPRVVDVLRERIEENIDVVLVPIFDALGATDAVVLNIRGGGQTYESVPHHEVRLKAARELLDRAYGRPRQTTEIAGEIATRPALDLSKLDEDDLEQLERIHAKAGA